MVPAITHQELEDGYDPLGLLLNDDDAKGILDALACLDDCHPIGSKPSVGLLDNGVTYGPVPPPSSAAAISKPDSHQQQLQEQKKPSHPYFYYRDFSTLSDPDPATPITAPGRIPNFPAKMYAILSRKDLADIITWLPHGRSWKVLKPREFEVKVIPTYFEHSKFSSFIRQANGWGFRRIISKGGDRNSYYHELFLRGRPHLIKLMRRPPPSSKPLADATTEPDFHAISEERPLPDIKEGDAATDAVARGNFPRQATYSFIPPSSYVPHTRAANTSAATSAAPRTTAAPSSYSSGTTPQEPTNHVPAPVSSGYGHATGYQATAQQPVYHQPTAPQYHYVPPPQEAAASHSSDYVSPSGPSIHPVDSSDSLLDLLTKPLPAPEMFGSHTFYPLLD
ncbi:HSF-type DNA-binding protein [Nitzschia inconspicua]|uniref:HSF-type DNA-binding protein n=1 Tax=Nitzschia inconspicua TaxID=303405 RepID=A0A9K3M9E9_9STRA|nr:HSF-type DNA-binding protein [Nitzschia inconspicua]